MSQPGRLIAGAVGVIVSFTVVVAFWRSSVPRVLLLDVAASAMLMGLVAFLRRSSEGKGLRKMAWAGGGAFLVAALAALPWMGWWLFVAVLAFAAGAVRTRPRPLRMVARAVALGAVGGVANLAVLGSLATGEPLRVDPSEYRSADLRVHKILEGVPLHDVWAVRLGEGGHGRSLEDVHVATRESASREANPMVMALVGLRMGLGYIFGWDDEADVDPGSSYANRLTEADRERSTEEPGRRAGGSFSVLYSFEHEEVYEIRNRTVHAFMVRALEPAPAGYTLYWAIYVKPGQSLTAVYMGLIDPFRRLFVYPDMLLRTQQTWDAKWGNQGASRSAR